MKKTVKYYIVYWGYGQSQKVNSKTEAINIARELLGVYESVRIDWERKKIA